MNERVIEVENLNFSYPDKTIALRNINFSVFRGESLAIIGPNGAGKSTLLLHLNGVLRGEGTVRVLGEKISKENIKRIREKVGMVFQDPNDQLFMPTVFDDVAFGPLNLYLEREEIEKRVDSILKELGLEGYGKKSPSHLSLGEKKKVSLATVLVLEPEILVLDEPTISLDPGTKRIFIDIFKDIKKTKLIATHDLDLILQLCSKVVLMDKGTVIAEGACRDILRNKKLLEDHSLEVPASLALNGLKRQELKEENRLSFSLRRKKTACLMG
jgi:cobalt/nickel transport system ATP-binding protein